MDEMKDTLKDLKKVRRISLLISSIGCAPFFLMIFCVFVVVLFVLGIFDGGGSSSGGKTCVNVKSADEICKSITVSGYSTMSVDEYVAGVVQHEFGGAPEEVLKAQAIAARSYGLAGASKDSNGNCSINDTSEGFQTYSSSPSDSSIQAANDTSGMIMVDENGNIASTEYSSNSLPAPYSSYGSTVTMSERNLEIPKDWWAANKTCSDSQLNTITSKKDAYGRNVYGCGHGRGMGQIAAKYLAVEKNYTYDQILDYFYGSDSEYNWSLASTKGATTNCTSSGNGNFGSLTSYNLNHDGLNILSHTLSDSDMNSLNNYIEQEIKKNDSSYSNAVAAAGQALVYWFEQQGTYLGYYWGGGHELFTGASSSWGSNKGSDDHGHTYYGMDCSGFVSWSIRNACKADFSALAENFLAYGNSISLDDAKPGDVIASSAHVMLVVKNNGDGTVTVAEEGGTSDGLVFSKVDSNRMSYGNRKVIDMTNWYKNNCS